VESLDGAGWRKSSYSGTGGGDCVEAADRTERVLVRDTADRGGAVLSVSPSAWREFIDALR
jgi:hypothetical protein